jgi:hypothetical protein
MSQMELSSDSGEYLGALRPVRLGKTIAWLIVLLALAVQVTAAALAVGGNLLEPARESMATTARAAATHPSRAPASMPASAPSYASDLRQVAGWVLPVTKFAGPLCGLALVVLLLAATQISLVGRLGGARGFSSAFVWSLVLLLTLVPWQQVLGGLMGAGVLTDFHELLSAASLAKPDLAAGKYTSVSAAGFLCRFFVWPFVSLMVWLIVGLRFAQGMKKVREATTVTPPEQR